MLEKIDHIGIAVNSIDDSMVFYKCMGAELSHIEEVPSQKVRTAFITIGDVHIELLEPTGEDSQIAVFLAKKGEGMHHIAYLTDNIHNSLCKLKSEGLKLINEEPVKGANKMLIAFIHPKSTSGVLTELCQHDI